MTNNLISVRDWKRKAWEELLEKAFSRCLVAHLLFWRALDATMCTIWWVVQLLNWRLQNSWMATLLDYSIEGLTSWLDNRSSIGRCTTCHLDHDSCVLDKKVKFGTVTHHLHGFLVCVHVDIWGPTKTVSLGGYQYFVSIVDDYSKHCWIYLIRQRVEILELLVKWKKLREN